MARCARRSPWRACETRRLGTPMRSWAPCYRLALSCAGRGSARGFAASRRRRSLPQDGASRHVVVRLERAQRLETRVDVVVRVIVGSLVEPAAADDAQAGAIRPAERRDRLGQLDRLADRRLEVELVVVVESQRRPARRRSATGCRWRGRATAGTPRWRSTSTGTTIVAQAAAAFGRERRRQVGRREDPAVGPDQADAALDRFGQPQILAKVDARRRRRRRSRSAPGSSARSPATFQVSGPVRWPLGHRGAWDGSPASSLVSSSASPSARRPARPRERPRAVRRAWRSPS